MAIYRLDQNLEIVFWRHKSSHLYSRLEPQKRILEVWKWPSITQIRASKMYIGGMEVAIHAPH